MWNRINAPTRFLKWYPPFITQLYYCAHKIRQQKSVKRTPTAIDIEQSVFNSNNHDYIVFILNLFFIPVVYLLRSRRFARCETQALFVMLLSTFFAFSTAQTWKQSMYKIVTHVCDAFVDGKHLHLFRKVIISSCTKLNVLHIRDLHVLEFCNIYYWIIRGIHSLKIDWLTIISANIN